MKISIKPQRGTMEKHNHLLINAWEKWKWVFLLILDRDPVKYKKASKQRSGFPYR
jgi:hypothetical protein